MNLWISSAWACRVGWYRVCVTVDSENPTRQYAGVHGNHRFLPDERLQANLQKVFWLSTGVNKPVHRNSVGL